MQIIREDRIINRLARTDNLRLSERDIACLKKLVRDILAAQAKMHEYLMIAVGRLVLRRQNATRYNAIVEAAEIMASRSGEFRFILPLAPTVDRAEVEASVSRYNVAVKVVEGRAYDLMSICDMAFIASGTATLEAAIEESVIITIFWSIRPNHRFVNWIFIFFKINYFSVFLVWIFKN